MQELFGAAIERGGFKAFIGNFADGVLLFVGGEGEDGGDFERLGAIGLQGVQRFVVMLGGLDAADGEHGIKAFAGSVEAVGFGAEVRQDVARDFANALGVQQGFAVFGGAEFAQVLLAFDDFELGAHVVVVDFEFEHLVVANGVGDNVSV